DNLISDFILKKLPIPFLQDFCEIFQISYDYFIYLLRTLLHNNPTNSSSFKRALNIIVKLNMQSKFTPDEILLPLILNSQDHLIQVYIDKKPELEEYVLSLLNYLYQQGGKRLRDILINE